MMQYIPWTKLHVCHFHFIVDLLCCAYSTLFNKDFIDLFRETSNRNHKLAGEYDMQNPQHQAAIDKIRAYLGQAAYYTLAKQTNFLNCRDFFLNTIAQQDVVYNAVNAP